jgi:acyl-CoA thioesterase
LARTLGIELEQVRPGFARCVMVVGDHMLNFHGTAHGGAIFTLADAAFAAACNASGQKAVALEMNISFLEPVNPGTHLVAEAKEEAGSGRIGLYHLQVTDTNAHLVASLHATAYRKDEWFDENM